MEPTKWGGILLALIVGTAAGAGLLPAAADGTGPAASPAAVDAGPTASSDAGASASPAALSADGSGAGSGAGFGAGLGAGGEGAVVVTTPLRWVGAEGLPDGAAPGAAIEGTSVTSVATEDQATVTVETRALKPGHAYTFWFVFWMNPDLCLVPPTLPDLTMRCGLPDFFGPGEARAFWGAGAVADADGEATVQWTAVAGQCWEDRQVAFPGIGPGAGPCLPEDGDMSTFEYQVSVRDHGPYDPDTFGQDQVETPGGGCNAYDCETPQDNGAWTQMPSRCDNPVACHTP